MKLISPVLILLKEDNSRTSYRKAGGLTDTFDNIVVSKEFTDIDEFDIESSRIENVANISLDFELTANSVIKYYHTKTL